MGELAVADQPDPDPVPAEPLPDPLEDPLEHVLLVHPHPAHGPDLGQGGESPRLGTLVGEGFGRPAEHLRLAFGQAEASGQPGGDQIELLPVEPGLLGATEGGGERLEGAPVFGADPLHGPLGGDGVEEPGR